MKTNKIVRTWKEVVTSVKDLRRQARKRNGGGKAVSNSMICQDQGQLYTSTLPATAASKGDNRERKPKGDVALTFDESTDRAIPKGEEGNIQNRLIPRP